MKVRLYVCNDLIIVTKVYNDEKEEGFMKLFLDAKSFVEAPMDGKYFINKLFICGQKSNIHLNFFTEGSRDKMEKSIKSIIKNLYKKEINRQSLKKKAKIKMHVFKFEDIKIKAQPQLRMTVVGV